MSNSAVLDVSTTCTLANTDYLVNCGHLKEVTEIHVTSISESNASCKLLGQTAFTLTAAESYTDYEIRGDNGIHVRSTVAGCVVVLRLAGRL